MKLPMQALLLFLSLCLARAQAQVLVNISPTPKLQFLDVNGKPLAGGCVFTYAAGTTTPQATYTDNTGATQNTNPVILDSGGRASIWLNSFQAYKFAVWANGGFFSNNCAQGQLQYTTDGINAAFSASSLGITGIFTAPNINGVLWVGPSPGQYQSIAAAYAAASSGQTIAVSPGWTDPTWTANLALTKSNVVILLMGSGSANAGSFQITCPGGIGGSGIVGLSPTGALNVTGFGTAQSITAGGFSFKYTGSGTFIACGSASNPTNGMRFENFAIDMTGAGSSAIAVDAINWEVGGWIRGLGIIETGAANNQVGIQFDGGSGGNSFDFSVENNQIVNAGTCFLLNNNTQELFMAGNQCGVAAQANAICNVGLSITGIGNRWIGGNIVGCTIGVTFGAGSTYNYVDGSIGSVNTGAGSPAFTFNAAASHNTVITESSTAPTVTDNAGPNGHNSVSQPGTGLCYDGCTTTVVKTGTGSGTYDSSSTSFTNVDNSNLSYTVTIPTGWKLLISASAEIYTITGFVQPSLAIADGGTPVVQTVVAASSSTTLGYQATLVWAITGDGNSHTITLQYKTDNSADHVEILNAASGVPVMMFLLTTSN